MAPRKKAVPTIKKEIEKVLQEVLPTEKKYRCDFETWEEYYAYKGPKG